MAVVAAMHQEGAGAVPIVAHAGEEILSTRNGDAQFYRALKQRGVWNEMRSGVNNYADGGTVLSGTTSGLSVGSRSGDININVPVTVEKGADMGADKAQQLSQVLRAAVQQELVNQKRPGGLLHR